MVLRAWKWLSLHVGWRSLFTSATCVHASRTSTTPERKHVRTRRLGNMIKAQRSRHSLVPLESLYAIGRLPYWAMLRIQR
jgi:hypothetical protein